MALVSLWNRMYGQLRTYKGISHIYYGKQKISKIQAYYYEYYCIHFSGEQ